MKVLVVGLGNILRGDDGLGPILIKILEKLSIDKDPNIRVVDCGTSAMCLLNHLDNVDKVIIIDAIIKRGKPGAIYHFKIVLENKSIIQKDELYHLSFHEISFEDLLLLLYKIGWRIPREIVIIGCEPEDISNFRIGLSSSVKNSLPELIKLVLREIGLQMPLAYIVECIEETAKLINENIYIISSGSLVRGSAF